MSSVQTAKNQNSVHDPAFATDRYELSMAFRLAEKFGFHEGICNHFSVRLDTDHERYLINPYGHHWSEISADDLLLIDGDGIILEGNGVVEDTARFIHVAGHRANSRHKAIFHTHMPYSTALTMIDNGRLEMAHQTATRFLGRTAYEDRFGGLALSNAEGERLAQKSKKSPEVDINFLANHGIVVGGPTVAQAFDDLYYLERACRQQIFAMQSGGQLKLIPDEIVSKTSEQIAKELPVASREHFTALCRVLEKNPDKVFVF